MTHTLGSIKEGHGFRYLIILLLLVSSIPWIFLNSISNFKVVIQAQKSSSIVLMSVSLLGTLVGSFHRFRQAYYALVKEKIKLEKEGDKASKGWADVFSGSADLSVKWASAFTIFMMLALASSGLSSILCDVFLGYETTLVEYVALVLIMEILAVDSILISTFLLFSLDRLAGVVE